MTENPYSPPDPASTEALRRAAAAFSPPETAGEKWRRLGVKTLAWVLILVGAIGFLRAIMLLYTWSNVPIGGSSGGASLFSVRNYAMFLIPALTVQSGLLVRSKSKWAVAACFAILAFLAYAFLKIYYRYSPFDQRSFFNQAVDQMPSVFAVEICGYLLVFGILVMLWKAGELK